MAQAQEKGFVFEDWVRDGIRGLRHSSTCLPEDFRKHMRTARKEVLLAYRSLLDTAIEKTEEAPKKRTSIKVE